jgi:hypothetical protein
MDAGFRAPSVERGGIWWFHDIARHALGVNPIKLYLAPSPRTAGMVHTSQDFKTLAFRIPMFSQVPNPAFDHQTLSGQNFL